MMDSTSAVLYSQVAQSNNSIGFSLFSNKSSSKAGRATSSSSPSSSPSSSSSSSSAAAAASNSPSLAAGASSMEALELNPNAHPNMAGSQLNVLPRLKGRFSTPEGKYLFRESCYYLHPTGKVFHAVKWCPVRLSIISYKHQRIEHIVGNSNNNNNNNNSSSSTSMVRRSSSSSSSSNSGNISGSSGAAAKHTYGEGVSVAASPAINATATATATACVNTDLNDADSVAAIDMGPTLHFKTTSEPTAAAPTNSSSSSSSSTPVASSSTSQSSSPSPSVDGIGKEVKRKSSWSLVGMTKNAIKSASSIFKSATSRGGEKTRDGFIKTVGKTFPLEGTCLVFNVGKMLLYHEYCGVDKDVSFKTPLEQDLFVDGYPTSHDFNQLTRGNEALELVIGLSTAEILVKDSVSNVVKHYNKAGCIILSKVQLVKWVPGSENLFLVAFQNGVMALFDKDREDPLPVLTVASGANNATNGGNGPVASTPSTPQITITTETEAAISSKIEQGSDNPFLLNKNQNSKLNPVTTWKILNGAINDFSFSPDCKHLAIVGKDGFLRVFDFITDTLIMSESSYFGGITCVAWSPDGKYLLTGGEDDLVSFWSFEERRLIARCEGHSSWVSHVAFDPYVSDQNTYRFGSVGQDTRLLLWEIATTLIHSARLKDTNVGIESVSDRQRAQKDDEFVLKLSPIVSHKAHHEPLTYIAFRDDAILTACQGGVVKLWLRPSTV